MKTSTNTKKNIDPEFGVDSKYKSLDKRLEDGKNLMEARLKRLKGLTRNHIIKAILLQLNL